MAEQMTKSATVVDTIRMVLDRVRPAQVKSAADPHPSDSGEAGKDITGKDTTHPVANVDDHTQAATTGARAAENTADVKKDVPANVDAAKAPEATGNGNSIPDLTNAKPTGEDPAHETASAGSGPTGGAGKDINNKDTEHPAKASIGEKYSSWIDSAEQLLAKVASFKQAAPTPPKKAEEKKVDAKKEDCGKCAEAAPKKAEAAPAAPAAEPTAEEKQAAEDGYRLAQALASFLNPPVASDDEMNKQAAALMTNLHNEAVADAQTLAGFYAAMMKRAEDLNAEGAGGMPPDGAAALGEGAPAEGGEGAGGGEDAALEQLMQELQAQGISPEMLSQIDPDVLAQVVQQLAQQGGGDGGGEMPPGGGAPSPEGAGAPMA